MFSSRRCSFGRARDRCNPRFLGQQPRECDLSGCRPLPFPHAGEQIDQSLVGLDSLRRAEKYQQQERSTESEFQLGRARRVCFEMF